MGRSRGFGPHAYDLNATLRLAFASAPALDALALPQTNTRRSIMQKVRRHPFPLRGIGLRPLVSVWFQVLLTQLVAVLFTFQSPYFFTIGHRVVFSLARWAGRFHAGFHESSATLERLSTPISVFGYGAFTLFGLTFQTVFLTYFSSRRPQPRDESRFGLCPLSLAATYGINVFFFSSGYLDVSVPQVRSIHTMNSCAGNGRLCR